MLGNERTIPIPPTISKDPIKNHETYTVRKRQRKKLKIHAILFSLPTVIANKPTKQETQCRSSQFAFY